MNMKTESGFNIIELMIVVVIIGILFAISLPAYQNYTLRSHRTGAHSSLVDIAARQERFVMQNNSYTTEISGAAGLNIGSTESREGYYNLEVAACAGGTIATCYQITATAAGSQTADNNCLTIGYSSTGVKSGTTDECW